MKKHTKEHCAELAAQCSTRTEFLSKHQREYHAAHSRGWLEEICAHMPVRRFGARKYTDDKIKEIVGQYSRFTDFRTENPSLFVILSSQGRLDKFTAHLERGKAPNGYWTKERCAEKAAECATRSDFMSRFSAAADAAYREGWMNDICYHMERIGNHKSRAIYVIKAIGAKRCYVGLSAHPQRRYVKHQLEPMKHLVGLISGPHRFKVVTGYLPVDEAIDIETRLCEKFRAKGYEVLNKLAGGQLGASPRMWTKASVTALAKTLSSRTEMARQHSGAYDAAHRNGWLAEAFSDHPERGYGDGPVRDWTLDRLTVIAAPFKSSSQFKSKEPKAWQAAYRRGLLKELFPKP